MADLKIYDIFDLGPLKDYIRANGELRRYRRNQHFTTIGTPTPELGLVVSGCFAFSHPDYKGDTQTVSFASSGELIGALITPGDTSRAVYDITAICNSDVIIVDKREAINHIEELHPSYKLKLINATAAGILMRAISQRCDSPEYRYRQLLDRVAGIETMIPMKAIASYLGMTRENFARLRRRIGKSGSPQE